MRRPRAKLLRAAKVVERNKPHRFKGSLRGCDGGEIPFAGYAFELMSAAVVEFEP